MRLAPLIRQELCWVLNEATTGQAVLENLCGRMATVVPEIEPDAMSAGLSRWVELMPTCTPEGVAFPHCNLQGVEKNYVAAAVVKPAVKFGDCKHPADLLFVVVGPTGAAWEHISILARLARICRGHGALDKLRSAKTGAELFATLAAEDESHG